ncbi:MAG: hypothetical protein JRF63_15700 [Deltaproteobacteria bacterium]|nr:hypothetical protein [Deltaproteobacteria bacterium]
MKRTQSETDPRVLAYVASLRELSRQRVAGRITNDEYWAAFDVLDERFADVRDWRGTSDPDKRDES